MSTPAGLHEWYTLRSQGEARVGAEYTLFFGDTYDWRAIVSDCVADEHFSLVMGRSDADWAGTRVSVRLQEQGAVTQVQFAHTGWPAANGHFRTSSLCWALYLRVLRRYVEHGERVPYDQRLDV